MHRNRLSAGGDSPRTSRRALRENGQIGFAETDFGSLRRLTPISEVFGWDRGTPIDRYYIEKFLSAHKPDIRGRALEIGDDRYIRRFGGDRVVKADVLHYVEGNEKATIVADLGHADHIPSDTFDCIILTQTLQMIYEVREAIRDLHRILRPGGVILVTAHGTSRICRELGVDQWGEFWRFTAQSARLLFEERFDVAKVDVKTYGNVLAAVAFLQGLAAEELETEELDYHDPKFELLIGVRAVKS